MTNKTESVATDPFTAVWLPRWIALGALAVYLATLNHWMALSGLSTAARALGWPWQPALSQPVTWLILSPFRWLPHGWAFLGMNTFTAVCAALVLVQLGRSVALWPTPRMSRLRLIKERPFRPSKAAVSLPTIVAGLVCALHPVFWEHATTATGEMLDLLLVAYVIRCLLEYRLDRKRSWLLRAAFLCGIGVVNNWAMVGLVPLFLIAAAGLTFGFSPYGWVQEWFERRRRPREPQGEEVPAERMGHGRLWLWIGLCLAAGLAFYLLAPVANALDPGREVGFWPVLKGQLKLQRAALLSLPVKPMLFLGLTALVPLLLMCIGGKSQPVSTGGDNPLDAALPWLLQHFWRGLMIVWAVYLTLDPPFSPRYLGVPMPALTYFYVLALVAGHCCRYILLLGASRTRKMAHVVTALLALLVALLPLTLGWRYLGQIRLTNSRTLQDLARQLFAGLPDGKSTVLSDDLLPYYLARAELRTHPGGKDPLLLDTQALLWPQYHRSMARQFGLRWPVPPLTNWYNPLPSVALIDFLHRCAAQEPVVYLHPSFGYYFESFRSRPRLLVEDLAPRPGTGTLDANAPRLEPEAADANERSWQELWTRTLLPLSRQLKAQLRPTPPAGRWWSHLRPMAQTNATLLVVGSLYSRWVNAWAVDLERLDRWSEARLWLERALELNPDNLAARLNLDHNIRFTAGDKTPLDAQTIRVQFAEQFNRFRGWDDILVRGGPLDEPACLFQAAGNLFRGQDYRQAAEAYARCSQLAPDWRDPQYGLAESLLVLRQFPGVIEITDKLTPGLQATQSVELVRSLYCRATALHGLRQTNEAMACIEDFLARYPNQKPVQHIAAQLCIQQARYQPALALMEQLLQQDPTNAAWLALKGFAQVELAAYTNAIETLTAALTVSPTNHAARCNRALAFLKSGQVDAAAADYESLVQVLPQAPVVLYGLGEIAWRRQDSAAAIRWYRQYLSNALPSTADFLLASNRLAELERGGKESPPAPKAGP